MLDEYYRLRGWAADGVPTAAKLAELGLVHEGRELGIS
jgi:aldehyde:ferredoxin oxidoreductase